MDKQKPMKDDNDGKYQNNETYLKSNFIVYGLEESFKERCHKKIQIETEKF